MSSSTSLVGAPGMDAWTRYSATDNRIVPVALATQPSDEIPALMVIASHNLRLGFPFASRARSQLRKGIGGPMAKPRENQG
jgi:hypothetical protein